MAEGQDAEDRIRWVILDEAAAVRVEEAVRRSLSTRTWVKAAYLYGSVARPGGRGRDIDIGLVADPLPSDPDDLRLIANELEAATGIDASVFDVRVLNGSSPVLLNEVLSSGRRIHEADTRARIEFEALAMSLWLDFKPVWERMRRDALERWSHG